MADYAPNYTPRYRVRYTANSRSHSLLFRLFRGQDATAVPALAGKVATWLGTMTTIRYTDWTVLGAEFAAQDSDVFLPAAAPSPAAGTVTIAGLPKYAGIVHISFPARSDIGGRGVLYLYGVSFGAAGILTEYEDFRLTGVESTEIGSAVSALNAAPELACNDGAAANWYNYVNVKYNDHWLKRLRKGA